MSFLIDFVLLKSPNGFGLPLLLVGVAGVVADIDSGELATPVSSEVDNDTSGFERIERVPLTGFLTRTLSPA